MTPLARAVCWGNAEVVQYLVEVARADVNARDRGRGRMSVIAHAMDFRQECALGGQTQRGPYIRRLEMCRALLRAGADPTIGGARQTGADVGLTVLMLALGAGKSAVPDAVTAAAVRDACEAVLMRPGVGGGGSVFTGTPADAGLGAGVGDEMGDVDSAVAGKRSDDAVAMTDDDDAKSGDLADRASDGVQAPVLPRERIVRRWRRRGGTG
jgi:ribosomal protein S14